MMIVVLLFYVDVAQKKDIAINIVPTLIHPWSSLTEIVYLILRKIATTEV